MTCILPTQKDAASNLGRFTLANTRVLILVQDRDVRILNAATGELLRELVLDPARDYQPTGKPRRRPKQNNPEPP